MPVPSNRVSGVETRSSFVTVEALDESPALVSKLDRDVAGVGELDGKWVVVTSGTTFDSVDVWGTDVDVIK